MACSGDRAAAHRRARSRALTRLRRITVTVALLGGCAGAGEARAPAAARAEPADREADERGDPRRAEPLLPPEVIREQISARSDALRACYEAGLGRNPELSGHVTVRFVVARDGRLVELDQGGSDLPDDEVLGCIAEIVRSITVPPDEDIVGNQFLLPFRFCARVARMRREST